MFLINQFDIHNEIFESNTLKNKNLPIKINGTFDHSTLEF